MDPCSGPYIIDAYSRPITHSLLSTIGVLLGCSVYEPGYVSWLGKRTYGHLGDDMSQVPLWWLPEI